MNLFNFFSRKVVYFKVQKDLDEELYHSLILQVQKRPHWNSKLQLDEACHGRS